jgi:hypothetical protein
MGYLGDFLRFILGTISKKKVAIKRMEIAKKNLGCFQMTPGQKKSAINCFFDVPERVHIESVPKNELVFLV